MPQYYTVSKTIFGCKFTAHITDITADDDSNGGVLLVRGSAASSMACTFMRMTNKTPEYNIPYMTDPALSQKGPFCIGVQLTPELHTAGVRSLSVIKHVSPPALAISVSGRGVAYSLRAKHVDDHPIAGTAREDTDCGASCPACGTVVVSTVIAIAWLFSMHTFIQVQGG